MDHLATISSHVPSDVTRGFLVGAIEDDRLVALKRCWGASRTRPVEADLRARHPSAEIVHATVDQVHDFWADLSVDGIR